MLDAIVLEQQRGVVNAADRDDAVVDTHAEHLKRALRAVVVVAVVRVREREQAAALPEGEGLLVAVGFAPTALVVRVDVCARWRGRVAHVEHLQLHAIVELSDGEQVRAVGEGLHEVAEAGDLQLAEHGRLRVVGEVHRDQRVRVAERDHVTDVTHVAHGVDLLTLVTKRFALAKLRERVA